MAKTEPRKESGTFYFSIDDLIVAKTLCLPKGVYEAAIAKGHPEGFAGFVRDALTAALLPS